MSTYYYLWQASQQAQDAGMRTILGGALALWLAWACLPILPKQYQSIGRNLLSGFIILAIAGVSVLLMVAR